MSKIEKVSEELEQIKNDLRKIIQKIESLEMKMGMEHTKNRKIENLTVVQPADFSLEEKFIDYLHNVAKLKKASIKAYVRDLKRLSKLILRYLKLNIPYEVIEIGDPVFLNELANRLYENTEFMEFNRKSHNHYSAPLNNYLAFIAYNSNSFVFED